MPLTPAAQHRPGRRAWAAAALALALALAAGTPALAHETDQYTLPVGREFADLGPHFSRIAYDAVAAAVAEVNAAIAEAANPAGEHSAVLAGRRMTLAQLQAPELIAPRVWSHLFAAMPTNELLDLWLQAPGMQARYPGLVTLYRPGNTIYDDPLLVIDLTKIVRSTFRAGMVRVGDTLFGTDKLIHFVNVGQIYHAAYLDGIAQGLEPDAAVQAAIAATSANPLTSEDGMLGGFTTGIRSNGDLAADYAGLSFYRNLTEPLRWGERTLAPMLEREGRGWRLAVTPDSDFFTVFVLPHWNEVLNPNVYARYFAWRVRQLVAERCADALDAYRDGRGRLRTRAQFEAIERELGTVYGVPYDHQARPDRPVSMAAICFDGSGATQAAGASDAAGAAALQRDALWWAAHDGQVGRLRELLAAGASPAAADADGDTALHAAARAGQAAAVEALLAAGAAVDARGAYGATPLMVAAAQAQAPTALLLLRGGADPNVRGRFGQSALHAAALAGSARLAALLLDHGADARLADAAGTQALHLAVRAGNEALVDELLAHGADARAADRAGATPLGLAREAGNAAIEARLAQQPPPPHLLVAGPQPPAAARPAAADATR